MIYLDTNYLIRGITPGTSESEELIRWTEEGIDLITPMPAWYEFLCGPVTSAQIATLRSFLLGIIPFDEAQAVEAARLFNAANRKRSVRVDAMIAATAITSGASLATRNHDDFAPFVSQGLVLV